MFPPIYSFPITGRKTKDKKKKEKKRKHLKKKLGGTGNSGGFPPPRLRLGYPIENADANFDLSLCVEHFNRATFLCAGDSVEGCAAVGSRERAFDGVVWYYPM